MNTYLYRMQQRGDSWNKVNFMWGLNDLLKCITSHFLSLKLYLFSSFRGMWRASFFFFFSKYARKFSRAYSTELSNAESKRPRLRWEVPMGVSTYQITFSNTKQGYIFHKGFDSIAQKWLCRALQTVADHPSSSLAASLITHSNKWMSYLPGHLRWQYS